MNKSLTLLIILLALVPVTCSGAQEPAIRLDLNKHYFITGETIGFSIASPDEILIPDMPFYLALLKSGAEFQPLANLVRTRLSGQYGSGTISIPAGLSSGEYILILYHDPEDPENSTLASSCLYIYHPGDRAKEEISQNANGDIKDNRRSSISDQAFRISGIQVSTDAEEEMVRLRASLLDDKGDPVEARISISITDRRLFEFANASPENLQQPQPDISGKIPSDKISSEKADSLAAEGRYLHGKLFIDGQPADIIKVYLYAHRENEVILDKYITDYEGRFRFPEPSFQGKYEVKLFTFPESGREYTFEFRETAPEDSLYHLDPGGCHFPATGFFREQANKEWLISESYAEERIHVQGATPQAEMDLEASHAIILEDYTSFPTLAETIRELVPRVSIRYRKGKYEMRIFDARASTYCCNEDPLIFVNAEPFLDINPVMNIPADRIHSIEVIRPVEAIQHFGDIGVNGILRINLKPDIEVPLLASAGKASFTVPGETQLTGITAHRLEVDIPDFRSFLYWKGKIDTGPSGTVDITYRPSLFQGDFLLVIRGISQDGRYIDIAEPFDPTPYPMR